MAPKQDIEAGVAINLAGTIPSGHGLQPIRQKLVTDPRERQHIVGVVVSKTTKVDHPADDDDTFTPTMQFVDLVAITDKADREALDAMIIRARNAQPGQSRLEAVN